MTLLVKLDQIKDDKKTSATNSTEEKINLARDHFRKSMSNNLNISSALSNFYSFINQIINQIKNLSKEEAIAIKNFILEIDSILGCIRPLYESHKLNLEKKLSAARVKELLQKRQKFRSEKNFLKSDELRGILLNENICIEDFADLTFLYLNTLN